MAGLSSQASAKNDYFLGRSRHLLHTGGRRGLFEGSTECSNPSPGSRTLRRRGQPQLCLRSDAQLLSQCCCAHSQALIPGARCIPLVVASWEILRRSESVCRKVKRSLSVWRDREIG